MGNAILDVVLGLVLVYLVLALLATKVQEMLDGSVLRGRVSTLHQLLLEACGQSEDLKAQVLDNPLIYALYRGDSATKRTFLSSSGPSCVPPDLFARALLMALHDGGKTHPSSQYATPSGFVEARGKTNAAQYPKAWQSLTGLLVGKEASWPGFEAAIAQWFADIGDRADGWYKRRAQGWSLGVALGLCALLNADSLHIAKTLSTDSEQRSAFADLALRTNAQREAAAGNPPPAAATIDRPDVQAAAQLTNAIARLSDAAQRDKGFSAFTAAQLPKSLADKILNNCPGQDAKLKALDTLAWLYILPVVRTQVELARTQDDAVAARKAYTEAFNCLAHLSSWLTAAATFTTDLNRGLVLDANVAIEASKSALVTLRDQRAAPLLLTRAFLADPDTFRGCAAAAGTRSEFESCLQRTRNQSIRLPLLFMSSTTRAQFCTVVEVPSSKACDARADGPDACPAARPRRSSTSGCQDSFAANARLGIPELRLEADDATWLQALRWFGGILFTTLFVALGAPFWFDVLGRVANMRAAGKMRDAADDAARGRGTLAAPPPAPGPTPISGSPAAPGTPPFSDARNRFEADLTVAQKISLQQARGVPATGSLDGPTRSAIAEYCRQHPPLPVVEELDRELFYAITGRDVVKTPAALATLHPGRSSAWVQPVATRLMKVLGFDSPRRIDPATTTFTADVRALTVLYRYKKSPPTIVAIATGTTPEALDVVDTALIEEIEQLDATKPPPALKRHVTAPWLDWAFGELGQVEKDKPAREASNARICEYLDTAIPKAGDSGDQTAWCGAFVAWVLDQHAATLDAAGAARFDRKSVTNPLGAAAWDSWKGGARHSGKKGAAALAGAQPGDLVRFKPAAGTTGSGHVAFFIETKGAQVWVLGGNQSTPSRVSLIPFAVSDVEVVVAV